VREALFSILGPDLTGARVLDAYAGSGALGFEALSRGAAEATFVEPAPAAVRRLEENVRALGVEAVVTVIRGRVLEHLARASHPYGLILADPPYELQEEPAFLRAAAIRLSREGILVLERDIHGAPLAVPAGLRHTRTARYGSNCLEFYAPVPGDDLG